MGNKPSKPLVCPDCASGVSWNGTQFVCTRCAWTEHKEKPPSSRKIDLPEEVRRRTQSDPH